MSALSIKHSPYPDPDIDAVIDTTLLTLSNNPISPGAFSGVCRTHANLGFASGIFSDWELYLCKSGCQK